MDKEIKRAKCKCAKCGKDGYNHDFVMVITFNSKRTYFCSTECRDSLTEEEKMRLDCVYAMIDIIGQDFDYGKRVKDFVNNKINEFTLKGELETLHDFLYRRLIDIKCKIVFKKFKSAIQKAAYVFAIIETDLEQFILDKKIHEMRIVENREEFEIVPDKKTKGGKDISGLIGI